MNEQQLLQFGLVQLFLLKMGLIQIKTLVEKKSLTDLCFGCNHLLFERFKKSRL